MSKTPLENALDAIKTLEAENERLRVELNRERACYDCREFRAMKEAEVERLRADVEHWHKRLDEELQAKIVLRNGKREVEKTSEAKDGVILGLEGLLAAYRLGSPSRADAALTRLEKARAALAAAAPEEQWVCLCNYMNIGPVCTHCGRLKGAVDRVRAAQLEEKK